MNVKESFIDLATPTGLMRTHVFEPATETPAKKYPGLLFYTEIFQVTGPMRRLSAQFAAQGYVVLVPEIYHEHEAPGTVLGYDEPGKSKGNAYKHKTRLTTFDEDARVVIRALKEYPACSGRLGVVGFCIGGHLAFRAALNKEILAACCFYPTDLHSGTLGEGQNADSLRRVQDIRGELLMIWGRQDPHIPYEGRLAIYKTLHESGARFTWHEFNAEHAFMRDDGNRHNPADAARCLTLAYDLFHRTL
ncbi:dienelactone hydrolase family protein [bacterium]|nr:dienelactone hydrolase family protein [bacterium]